MHALQELLKGKEEDEMDKAHAYLQSQRNSVALAHAQATRMESAQRKLGQGIITQEEYDQMVSAFEAMSGV